MMDDCCDPPTGTPVEASTESPTGTPVEASTEPLSWTPVEASIEAQTEAPRASAAPAIEDWPDLVYALGLDGLAQEIAANSFAAAWEGDSLQLALPVEIHELLNPRNQDEIRQALERKLGLSLKLDWRANETLPGPSPLQVKRERERQQRDAAIAAIKQDRVVLKLQQALAAELDEASVVRIDENGNEEVRS